MSGRPHPRFAASRSRYPDHMLANIIMFQIPWLLLLIAGVVVALIVAITFLIVWASRK